MYGIYDTAYSPSFAGRGVNLTKGPKKSQQKIAEERKAAQARRAKKEALASSDTYSKATPETHSSRPATPLPPDYELISEKPSPSLDGTFKQYRLKEGKPNKISHIDYWKYFREQAGKTVSFPKGRFNAPDYSIIQTFTPNVR